MATESVKPSYQIAPPEPFDFRAPKEWPKWIRRFERFRQASQLAKADQESQVSTLIYSMGDQADDILMSFKLSSDEMKSYETIVEKFDRHFVPQHNVIFERAMFNQRNQQTGETVDSFITELYRLSEHCKYGDLKDEMIHPRSDCSRTTRQKVVRKVAT